MSLLASVLNPLREISIIIIARKYATLTIKRDSPKNCLTNCSLLEPTDFLTPTSLALFSDLAVDKFMKLIHANKRTNAPIIPNNHTYSIRPPVCTPFSKLERRYQSFIGKSKILG